MFDCMETLALKMQDDCSRTFANLRPRPSDSNQWAPQPLRAQQAKTRARAVFVAAWLRPQVRFAHLHQTASECSVAARPVSRRISELPHLCYCRTFFVMEEIMTRKVFGLAGFAAVLCAAPAIAHHAFAMFDQSKVLYLSGTVKQFEFVNPHAWLHVAVVNDKGDTSTWSFEGGSPSQLISLGWAQDHPRVG